MKSLFSILGDLSLSGRVLKEVIPDTVIVYSYTDENDILKVAHTKKENKGVEKKNNFTLLEECYSSNAGEVKLKWYRELIDPNGKPKGGSNYNRYRLLGSMGDSTKKGKFNRVPVEQFDIDGNLIREWESITSVSNSLSLESKKISKSIKNSTPLGGYLWRIKEGVEVKSHLSKGGKIGGKSTGGYTDLHRGEYSEEHRGISREQGIKLGNWVKDKWQFPTEKMMAQVKRGGEIGGVVNGVSPNRSWLKSGIQSKNSKKAHDKTVCCPHCGWPSDSNNAPRHIKNCNYRLNFNPLNYTEKLVKNFRGFQFVIYEDIVSELEKRHREIFPDSPDDSHCVPSSRRCLSQIDSVKEKYTIFYKITSGSRWGESKNSNLDFCKKFSDFFLPKKSKEAREISDEFKQKTGIFLNYRSLEYEKRKGNYGKPLSSEVRYEIGKKVRETYRRKKSYKQE